MSMVTWKEEFYPVTAFEVSEKDAAEHSLRKWIGLRPENLSRHGLRTASIAITDRLHTLFIDSTSCSLCKHHYYMDPGTRHDETYYDCPGCPIVAANNGKTCFNGSDGYLSPWDLWVENNEVEPMIEMLEKAAEYVKTQV